MGNFAQDGLVYEQNEIEFLPVPVREAADQLVIAKWIIRNLAYEEGLNVTFAPKITTGKAGRDSMCTCASPATVTISCSTTPAN